MLFDNYFQVLVHWQFKLPASNTNKKYQRGGKQNKYLYLHFEDVPEDAEESENQPPLLEQLNESLASRVQQCLIDPDSLTIGVRVGSGMYLLILYNKCLPDCRCLKL